MTTTLCQDLAFLFRQYKDAFAHYQDEKVFETKETIKKIVKDHFPSGSGFDAGTSFSFKESSEKKLVFETSFHHMDEYGGYCGWSEHAVSVYPDLALSFCLKVSGPNKNNIKEYIEEVFHEALSAEKI